MSTKNEKLLLYIIDDDESVLKGMTRLMRSAGIENHAYANAEDFIAEVRNDKHACIILDITMPHLNGLELCARLKDKGITLPVIAVSARNDSDTLRLAQELGVRLFLHKPVDDQALLDAISWMTSRDA